MANILGFAIVAYGGYLLSLSKMGDVDFNKGVIALVGGVIYLLWANADKFKKYIPTVTTKETKVFVPVDHTTKDFECLYHLKMRVMDAGNKEGIETCSKLNDIIFTLDNAKPAIVVEKK